MKTGKYGGKLLNRDKRGLREQATEAEKKYYKAAKSAMRFDEYIRDMMGMSSERDLAGKAKDVCLASAHVSEVENRIEEGFQLVQGVVSSPSHLPF